MNHMAIPPSKYGDILQESNQILREFATNDHPKRERERFKLGQLSAIYDH